MIQRPSTPALGNPALGILALAGLSLACGLLLTGQARAETILERVQRTHTLACAAEPRPGLAQDDGAGHVTGLAADLCLAVARAIAGTTATTTMTTPDTDNEFAALTAGTADLMFLSDEAIADRHLRVAVIPGPTVMFDPVSVMVPTASSAQTPDDLGGQSVCLMIGSAGHRALDSRLSRLSPPVIRQPFGEDVEMLDAYNVGRCDAVVAESSALAVMRHSSGVNRLQSRLLMPPLALTPILSATPATDPTWASRVAWALNDVLAGPDYATMREHNLGSASALRLSPWPNALWPAGLLVPSR